MEAMAQFVIGAGVVLAAGLRRAWEGLVERGRAVRPGDGSLAGALDRAVHVDVPSVIGQALGTTVDAGLRVAAQAQAAIAAGERRAEHASQLLLRRSGFLTAADLGELRARLDEAAAAIDRVATS